MQVHFSERADLVQWTKLSYPGIYRWLNLLDQKVYIGSAEDIGKRNGLKGRGNRHLRKAIEEDGLENFELAVIEIIPSEGLSKADLRLALLPREDYWIAHYHASDPEFGYNIAPTAASPLGAVRSKQTRMELSKITTELFQDPEYRERHSNGQLRRYSDPEQREHRSKNQTELWKDPEYRKMQQERRTYYKDPEYKQRRSEISKRIAEERKEELSKTTKEVYNRKPELRIAASERMKALNANPEFRRLNSVRNKKRWEEMTPERREQESRARKAGWERKRLEREIKQKDIESKYDCILSYVPGTHLEDGRKLNNEQVKQIREIYAYGCHTYRDLSKLFKIPSLLIGHVITRKGCYNKEVT